MTTKGDEGEDETEVSSSEDDVGCEIEVALEGRGVKLLLPGGALLLHMPTADGVVLIGEPWSAKFGGPSAPAVRIEYQDPQGGALRAFHLSSLQTFLTALEPFAVEEGQR